MSVLRVLLRTLAAGLDVNETRMRRKVAVMMLLLEDTGHGRRRHRDQQQRNRRCKQHGAAAPLPTALRVEPRARSLDELALQIVEEVGHCSPTRSRSRRRPRLTRCRTTAS